MNGSPAKVLILDDEETLRLVLSTELEGEGYQAFSFCSKSLGYDWSVKNSPDLIISDIKSPGMDGFQFLRWLKASPFTQHIPFIFVTGFADLRNAIEAKRLGAFDFVSKPCDLIDLLTLVDTILKERTPSSMLAVGSTLGENYDSDLVKYEPWERLHLRFQELLQGQDRRTTLLSTEYEWRTLFLIEEGKKLVGGLFLRPFDLGTLGVDEILWFRDFLHNEAIDLGILYTLFAPPPLTRELARLFGIVIVPPDVTMSWLGTHQSIDLLVHPSYGRFQENKPVPNFLSMADDLLSGIQSLSGEAYFLHVQQVGSKKREAIKLTQSEGWKGSILFRSEEPKYHVYITHEQLWLLFAKLWLTGQYREGDLGIGHEEHLLLFEVLCRLKGTQRKDNTVFVEQLF